MKEFESVLNQTIECMKNLAVENVVGKPIVGFDGTTILSVSKLSYGFVLGGGNAPKHTTTFGKGQFEGVGVDVSGGGVSITPLGFLVCGKDKKFVSVDGSQSKGKWMDLLASVANMFEKEEK